MKFKQNSKILRKLSILLYDRGIELYLPFSNKKIIQSAKIIQNIWKNILFFMVLRCENTYYIYIYAKVITNFFNSKGEIHNKNKNSPKQINKKIYQCASNVINMCCTGIFNLI